MDQKENDKTNRNLWGIFGVALAVVIVIGAVLILMSPSEKLVETVTSPDGKIQVSVYATNRGQYILRSEQFSGSVSIGDVRQYAGLHFSADSRYQLLAFEDSRIGHQFYLYDYETTIGGGVNLEVLCKNAPDIDEELTKNGVWETITFRFQRWHETDNSVLLSYTYQMPNGTEVSGEIWWDVENRRVSKN